MRSSDMLHASISAEHCQSVSIIFFHCALQYERFLIVFD
ncbi:hypothetical protein AB395_0000271 [Sinorhizobium fredii CCBAU 45436]|nr:hypothetical protein AB395_0000271 [Sinorhizobium fredii CCBAU 45436]